MKDANRDRVCWRAITEKMSRTSLVSPRHDMQLAIHKPTTHRRILTPSLGKFSDSIAPAA